MCWRLGCLFRGMPVPSGDSGDDSHTRLLVIGASGMTGNAVLDAAVACVWFRVIAFTRNLETLVENKHVVKGDVVLVKGDMLEMKSLEKAMEKVDVVFFNTAYWETRDMECEYQQGANVVEAAIRSQVKHLLYVGTPYSRFSDVKCKSLAARERVQELVITCGLPWTVIHMGFYYENFLSVFKPHPVEPLTYALALPMGNVALNCGSVLDFAHCITKMILYPQDHLYTITQLATGYHTVTQLVAWMDSQFPKFTIFDPKISIEEYSQITYDGSEEITQQFVFLQSFFMASKWDQKVAFDLCPYARTFTAWLEENEAALLSILNEDTIAPSKKVSSSGEGQFEEKLVVPSESYLKHDFFASESPERKSRIITKTCFRTIEEEKDFTRRANICDEALVLPEFQSIWQILLDLDG